MINLSFDQNKRSYRPGERIKVDFNWESDDDVEQVDVTLVWFTRGKGTEDIEISLEHEVSASSRRGSGSHTFTAPGFPYSFSGKLVSLVWAVEIVLVPSEESIREEIVISPTGSELVLPSAEVKSIVAAMPTSTSSQQMRK